MYQSEFYLNYTKDYIYNCTTFISNLMDAIGEMRNIVIEINIKFASIKLFRNSNAPVMNMSKHVFIKLFVQTIDKKRFSMLTNCSSLSEGI